MMEYQHELAIAMTAARRAGRAIMDVFGTAAVRFKADGSYVTDADLASDHLIREAIGAAFPGDAILTEEGADDSSRLHAARCWVIDPIDGTAGFVDRTNDFDVYLALVVDERPVVAVSLQPATGLLLSATAGGGAWITPATGATERLRYPATSQSPRLGTRHWLGAPANLPALERAANAMSPPASVRLPDHGLGVRSFIPPGNPVDAIVGMAVAGDELDAWEWDIAVVDLIAREAGGASTDLAGQPLRFNQPNPRLKDLLISTNPETHRRMLTAITEAVRA